MKRFVILALAIFAVTPLPATKAAESRPNVLMIMVDDMGWRDLSCYGSTFYQTINIDRLAKEGVLFTQAYAAHPRCARARFGIMAGKYPARVDAEVIEFSEPVSMGQAFRDLGYATFYSGKWAIGAGASGPEKRGFTKSVGAGNAAGPKSYFAPYNESRGQNSTKKQPIDGLDDAPKGLYLADNLTDETIKFIRDNKDRPFFAVLSHYALTPPIEAKPNYIARYVKKLQENPPADGAGWESEGNAKNKLKQDNPAYAGMIHSIDEGVGRILDLLNEFKLADRTIVVFCSDNGGVSSKGVNGDAYTSNRPLRAGKGYLYEGGIRIPLVVKWPGVTKGGSKCETPVISMDFYPTFLEIAGGKLKPELHLDGKSFAAFLKNPAAKPDQNRDLFWHNAMPQPTLLGDTFCSAVRSGQYKLIDYYAQGRLELYDLKSDLEERDNLIEKLGAKGAELKAKLDAWREEVNAPMATQIGAKAKPAAKELKGGPAKAKKTSKKPKSH